MHSCQDIEENRHFSNGGTNLHIHAIAQGRPEDNQVEFLQGPHGIVNPPKNLVLNNIRRFTQMANGLLLGANDGSARSICCACANDGFIDQTVGLCK